MNKEEVTPIESYNNDGAFMTMEEGGYSLRIELTPEGKVEVHISEGTEVSEAAELFFLYLQKLADGGAE